MATSLEHCYETLGLRPGASPREVRQAYIDLTKVWHPDRFNDDPRLKKKAEAKLREINAAYEQLRAAHEARAAKQAAARQGQDAARVEALPARLPVPEIMAALILVGVLAVLAVVVMACRQLMGSPAALLLRGLI